METKKIRDRIIKLLISISKWSEYNRAIFIYVAFLIYLIFGVILIYSQNLSFVNTGKTKLQWITATILLLFLCITEWWFERKNWLTIKAKDEFKKFQHENGVYTNWLLERLKIIDWRGWLNLGKWVMIFLLLSFVFISILKPISEITEIKNDELKSFFGNVAQIFASLFAIIVAIIIFAAERAEKIIKNFSEIVFRKAKLKLVVLSGLSFVLFLIFVSFYFKGGEEMISVTGEILSITGIVWLIVNIVLVTYLFWQIIASSKQSYYLNIIEEQLKADIKYNIKKELLERITEFLFFNKTEEFGYSRFFPSERGLIKIFSNKSGRVKDINLRSLEIIANRAEKKEDDKFIGYIPFLGQKVKKNKDPIFAVVGIPQKFLSRFKSQDLVKIEKGSSASYREGGLESLRNFSIQSIDDCAVKRFHNLMGVYERVIEYYSQQLNSFGFRLDKKQSREAYTFKVSLIDFLEDDLEYILLRAIKEQDRNFYGGILYKFKDFLSQALEENNFILFRKFVYFPIKIYVLLEDRRIASVVDDKLKKDLVRDSIRYLGDVVGIKIEKNLERASSPEEVLFLSGFLELIIESYCSLMKLAISENDIETYNFCLSKVKKFLKDFRPYSYLTVKMVEQMGDREDYKDLLKEANINESITKLKEDFDNYRAAMVYGLASWTIELWEANDIGEDKVKGVIESALEYFSDKKKTNFVFRTAFKDHFSESKFDFGWRSWDRQEREPGEIYLYPGRSKEWLIKFFVLWGLINVNPDTGDYKDIVQPSKAIKNLKGLIDKFASQVNENDEKFNLFIPTKKEKRIELFLKGCEEAVNKQEEIEKEWLILQQLSQKMIDKFKQRFFQEWKKEALARVVYTKFGAYEDKTSEPAPKDKKLYYGEDTIDDKGAFVEDWPIGYVAKGARYGKILANTENYHSLRPIVKNAFQIGISEASIIKNLDNLIDNLTGRNYTPQIIFIPFVWELKSKLIKNSDFIEKKSVQDFEEFKKFDSFLGTYKNIPILQLPSHIIDKKIITCDLTKFAKWKQYQVSNTPNKVIELLIEPITEEMAMEWIQKNPKEWLTDRKTGEAITKEEAKMFLLQKIHLLYGENFNIEVINKDAASAVIFGKE